MKTSLIGFLCLTLISIASCQNQLSPEIVKDREILFNNAFAWALKIDANFFKIHESIRTTAAKTFKPFFTVYAAISDAFNTLKQSVTTPNSTVPAALSEFVEDLGDFLEYYEISSEMTVMSVFGQVNKMELSSFAPPANQLLQNFHSYLSMVMMELTMPYYPGSNPPSERCIKRKMMKLGSLFDPIVAKVLEQGNDVINYHIPKIRTTVSNDVEAVVTDMKTLLTKLKNCNKKTTTAAKATCADNLALQYSDPAIDAFTTEIHESHMFFSQLVRSLVQNQVPGETAVYPLNNGYSLTYDSPCFNVMAIRDMC